MAIVIRDADDRDMVALNRFLTCVWHHTYDSIMGREKVLEISARWHTIDKLAAEIGKSGAVCLLALDADRIIGHVFATEVDPDIMKLDRLYIGPEHQRRGVGKRLLDYAFGRFPGKRYIRLEVDRDNENAIRFYQAKGFAIVGQIDDCGGDSDRPAHIMQWSF